MPESGVALIDEQTTDNTYTITDKSLGHCFYSTQIVKADKLLPSIMGFIDNKEMYEKTILVDHLIYNKDRNSGNILISYKKAEKVLYVIDHTHVFKNEAIWDANCLIIGMKENDYQDCAIIDSSESYSLFASDKPITLKSLKSVASTFKEKCDIKLISKVVEDLPEDWLIEKDGKMNNIQFSILSYYPSIINDENINVGLLFNNKDTDQRFFYILKNLHRLESFDDELDIDFIVKYLNGIKESCEGDLFSQNQYFDMSSFTQQFANELRFGKIQNAKVSNPKKFYEETIKMNFRFDYAKEDRPSEESVISYMKKMLRNNSITYSTKPIFGSYEEDVKYDYIINNHGFKYFIFEDKNIKRQLQQTKAWAFTAEKNKKACGYQTVFVIDSERRDDKDFRIALSILKENATVIEQRDVLSFINEQVRA